MTNQITLLIGCTLFLILAVRLLARVIGEEMEPVGQPDSKQTN